MTDKSFPMEIEKFRQGNVDDEGDAEESSGDCQEGRVDSKLQSNTRSLFIVEADERFSLQNKLEKKIFREE